MVFCYRKSMPDNSQTVEDLVFSNGPNKIVFVVKSIAQVLDNFDSLKELVDHPKSILIHFTFK